ncbi:hypothetical protein [Tannerella sp.]|uniref:hypothetical protein n=1 Tax=Tannerella sp. TaxID=2382127 RepID=UPI0026DA6F68|nr:hypothetical protein [Tannerella sp.]MDO4703695.1 hypothetical protein [Tannerella sp.]
MKRNFILTCFFSLLCLTSGLVKAQVKDVSVTVSPLIEYQWWNKNINLENNMFYGVRAGFGFGPHFELRAVAEKSFDIQGKLKSSKWNISDDLISKLPNHTVDITRLSGEAKLNILSGIGISPYILAGAGVQYFKYDPFTEGLDAREYKEQQIFASLGAGIKINLSPRIVFSLEGKQLLFNMDPQNAYFNPNMGNKDKRLANYAAMASLDIYLGGSNPSFISRLDKRVRDSYTSGFVNGLKFVLEPGVAYVNFSEKLPYTDQWFVGGSAGVDFSSLVGLRAYYYQATEDPAKLSFKFNDNLRMYGLNLIARLNQQRGIVPYLQFGGGYLDSKGYNFFNSDQIKENFDKNNLFLQLGGGIEIPVSRYFALFGTGNAMMMSKKGVSPEDIVKPSQIRTSMMYTAGLRINLGAPVKSGSELYASALESEREKNREKINAMRAEYEEKLNAVNAELAEALEKGDETRLNRLIEKRLMLSDERASMQTSASPQTKETMTAGEFEELVNRVMEKIRNEQKSRTSSTLSNSDFGLVLEALRQDRPAGVAATSPANDTLLNELKALSSKMDRNYEALLRSNTATEETGDTTIVVVPSQPATQIIMPTQTPVVTINHDGNVADSRVVTREDGSGSSRDAFLKYNRLAPIFGINFGEQVTANIGLRGYLQVSNTNFDFVPEFFLALGSRTGYGLSGNVLYNIQLAKDAPLHPYVGLGLGLFKQHKTLRAGTNMIVGTNLNFGNNALFVDYSIRNLFKNNQFSVGYRFVF